MQDESNVQSRPMSRLIEADPGICRKEFDRSPFPVRHNLAGHPLFEMRRLVELARVKEKRGELYFDLEVKRLDQRWDEIPRAAHTVEEIISRVRENQAWIVLRAADTDPEYCALLDRCMEEIKNLSGGHWQDNMRVQNAIVFINSPRRITTYHIDRECNFILQISGTKTVYIYDQNDRAVLPEEELERFWTIDNNAAIYKEQYKDRARVFQLRPGDGVHVPVNAPHWVQNGDDISITLSVNFQFDDTYRANIYRANYYLRKLGIAPSSPGKYPLRDKIKAHAIRNALMLRNSLREIRNP